MKNTVDIIKCLIMRIEQNISKKNKKMVHQLISQLRNKFYELLVEDDDEIFIENAANLFCNEGNFIAALYFSVMKNVENKKNCLYQCKNIVKCYS